MLAADAEAAAALDPPSSVRLLAAFDPYVVGSVRTDTDVLAEQHRPRVHRPQGWISPVLLVDGRIAGVWRHERAKGRIRVQIEPFARVPTRGSRRAPRSRPPRSRRYLGGEPEVRWAAPAGRRSLPP